MIKTLILLFIFFNTFFVYSLVWAIDEERRLEGVFLGRFASYIEMPDSSKAKFVITVIDKNPFGSFLEDFYRDKKINNKPVEVRYVTRVEDIGTCDLLFITSETFKQRQAIIDYAIKHSILTVGNSRGFAENGGIIQLNFVNTKPQIKINYDSAIKSGIKIGAPLLSIATVIASGGK